MSTETSVLDNSNTRRVHHLTVEMVLWAAVGTLALVLRLVHLGTAPLAAHEAHEAMLAWRAVTGQGMPEVGYSPFLFIANAFLFSLCGGGASDVLARLWPALLGTAFALTPLLFRRRVGRVGVLAAGVYLAISPTALFASRQLDGAVVVALGGAVLFGGGLRFVETSKRGWLILAATGLALAVTSGSVIYGMMLALGLAWMLSAWGWQADRLRWLGGLFRPHLGIAFATFVLAVFVFATGFGWNLAGVGAAADLFPAWFARLGIPSPLLLRLAIYEPLVLLTGLVCWVWLVWKRRRFGVLLGLWVGLGIFVQFAASPQTPVGTTWIILPLALLSGIGIEAAVQDRRAGQEWRAEWVYAFMTSALWVYLYLRFSRYGLNPDQVPGGNPLDLVVGIMALVSPLLLLALAALAFALISRDDRVVTAEILKGGRSALRGIVVSTTAVLLAITFSTGWGAAHIRSTDPRELLVYEPTVFEVRDLVQTLRDLSWRETSFPTTLKFIYEASPDSVLAWYLREFSAARRVDDLRELEPNEWGAAIVTSNHDWVPDDSLAGSDLVGQDFALSRGWSLNKISCAWEWPPCNEAFEWAILRAPTVNDRESEWAVLEPDTTAWAVIWTSSNIDTK